MIRVWIEGGELHRSRVGKKAPRSLDNEINAIATEAFFIWWNFRWLAFPSSDLPLPRSLASLARVNGHLFWKGRDTPAVPLEHRDGSVPYNSGFVFALTEFPLAHNVGPREITVVRHRLTFHEVLAKILTEESALS